MLILIVALLIGAAFIRVYHLASVPPGVASDSAMTLSDALRISRGIPFPATFGPEPEPLYRYLLAAWMLLTGPSEFSAMFFQTMVALPTVALVYRAGLSLLRGWRWRHLGAFVAAGAMAALAPNVFLARNIYRIILMPPVVLLAFMLLLEASRTGKKTQWALGGFFAAFCMHIYPPGLLAPLWSTGFVMHQWITSWRQRRLWRNTLWMFIGMAPPVLAWFTLIKLVPNIYGPTTGFSQATGDIQGLIAGLQGAIQAYFVVGHSLPNFNALSTPFLNPVLALFAFIGIGWAILRFYKSDGALFLGGLVLFTIPGALTSDKTYPLRYAGNMPLLSLLAGWGACTVAIVLSRPSRLRHVVRPLLIAGAILLVGVSLAATHIAYQNTFTDPARYAFPADYTSVPHNYSLAFENAMRYLTRVDRPTYMPAWMLDNPVAAYFLQREAYPNITTWARYGLKEFPAGQFFVPGYWMYHMTVQDDSTARVLLLPAEKTIVLLPSIGLPESIGGSDPAQGKPGVTEIDDPQYGWVLGRIRPVARADFVAPSFPPSELLPDVGNGLKLLSIKPIEEVKPGQHIHILVEWLVTAPQPTDIFSVVQLIKSDFSIVLGSDDHHVMFYLYPSARWQPGDIIPDWHEVTITENMPDGFYRWGAGAYVPPVLKRLQVTPPPGDYGPQLSDLWLMDALRVPASVPVKEALPDGVTASTGKFGQQIALEGYQLKQESSQWTLTLYWRASQRPTGDYTVFVHAERDGKIVAQHDGKPDIPTWAWEPGELVTTSHSLPITETPDHIYVGMYSYPSLIRVPVSQDGKPIDDGRLLLWSSVDSTAH